MPQADQTDSLVGSKRFGRGVQCAFVVAPKQLAEAGLFIQIAGGLALPTLFAHSAQIFKQHLGGQLMLEDVIVDTQRDRFPRVIKA